MKERIEHTCRGFLAALGMGASALAVGCAHPEGAPTPAAPADLTLRIRPILVDIAKDRTISTIGYYGPDPTAPIRLREGVPVTVELINDTDTPEFVHWHGMTIPTAVDGAEEEKSPVVPAHGHLRYSLAPAPSGALGTSCRCRTSSAAPTPASSISCTPSRRAVRVRGRSAQCTRRLSTLPAYGSAHHVRSLTRARHQDPRRA